MKLLVLVFLLFVAGGNGDNDPYESHDENHRDDDGFCVEIEPYDDIDEKLWSKNARRGLFMPLASKFAAYQMARAFRPEIRNFNKDSMKEFCPRFYRTSDRKCYMKAFGKVAEFKCKKINGHYGQRRWRQHGGDHKAIARHFKGDNTSVVWTDNEKYILAIRCHRERMDWKVLSPFKDRVETDGIDKIDITLEKYNISTNKKRMYRVNYDHCTHAHLKHPKEHQESESRPLDGVDVPKT